MASSSIQLFIRRDEFVDLIRELHRVLPLHVILHRLDPPALEIAGRDVFRLGDGSEADSIFFAEHEPTPDQLRRADDPNPAAWGWVEVDVPREVGSTLFLVQIGAKFDWWDETGDVMRGNPASVKLFKRIRRHLETKFRSPTWARNVVYGGEEPYPDVLHSTGAAEFARAGGELRQEGVLNVVFSTKPQGQALGSHGSTGSRPRGRSSDDGRQ